LPQSKQKLTDHAKLIKQLRLKVAAAQLSLDRVHQRLKDKQGSNPRSVAAGASTPSSPAAWK